MAVVYVGVCKATGEMYVGKHIHGLTGRSVRRVRWMAHRRCKRCLRLWRTINKYGYDSFCWYVLERVPEDVVNAREAFYISSSGLNTLSPHGLNLLAHDGRDTRVSEETRARISAAAKVAQNRPEVRAANSKRATEQANMPGAREAAAKRLKKLWNDDYDAVYERIAVKSEATKSKMKEAAATRWANPAQHEEACRRMRDVMTRPEVRQKMSVAGKARFPDEASKNAHSAMLRKKRRQAKRDACTTKEELDALEVTFAKLDKEADWERARKNRLRERGVL
mgnify:CR=1 FL=1